MVRRLLRRLWEHGKVPHSQIHKFLIGICDAVCRYQHVAALEFAPLYKREVQKFGAESLIDKASNPEVLDLWMQAIVLHKKPTTGADGKPLDGSTRGQLKRGTGFV